MASYIFLPWIRQGLSSAVKKKPTTSRAEFKVTTQITNAADGTSKVSTVDILLYGPGDVTSLDRRQIIRTVPPNLTPDFEPNYMPVIEFDRPELPWLFTPDVPDNQNHLQPWICLIVVEKREGVEWERTHDQLPVLTIKTEAQNELPNPEEAWAWAHVQVSGETFLFTVDLKYQTELDNGTLPNGLRKEFQDKGFELSQNITVEVKAAGSRWEIWDKDHKRAYLVEKGNNALNISAHVNNALANNPELTLSRLICPRHLRPKTAYYACVVPTYKAGLQAGLGQTVDTGQHAPAWEIGADKPVRLPVYYHWEFATGVQGDFESRVWQLEPRQLTLEEVGTRKLDIGKAGYDLPASDPFNVSHKAVVDLEGALLPPITSEDDLEGPTLIYQGRLQALVNETAKGNVPVVPPPIYGRWHAAQRTIPDKISSTQTRDRGWLREINLDPRYRVAAGLGAQIVREQQEQLVAAAWEQLGDIERANQMIRQAQLARAASTFIYEKRLGLLDAFTFMLVTGPVQSRVSYTASSDNQERTAYGHMQASVLPRAVTGAQFRRILRPRGKLARRFGIGSVDLRKQLIMRLNGGKIRPAPSRWPMPNGMFTIEDFIPRSPCEAKPSKSVEDLLKEWTPEDLEDLLQRINKTLKNIEDSAGAGLSSDVNEQLDLMAKNLPSARKSLDKYIKARAQIDETDLYQILHLYGQAWSFISTARQLIVRIVASYSGNPPDVIAALDEATKELPSAAELRKILFSLAAAAYEKSLEPCAEKPLTLKPPLNIDELKTEVHKKLNPRTTIPARISTLIEAPGWKADELEFILAGPDFPAPMYKSLAQLGQDWLLPGLERVPPNTLTLLEANNKFIEAFLVGLNHEWGREALWRDLPFEQRFTSFRQFFDPSGRFPPPADEKQRQENIKKGKDVPPIHEWGDEQLGKSLGKAPTLTGASSATQPVIRPIVLLLRGELLRRYPRASIYMVKAEWKNGSVRNPIKVTDENNPKQMLHPIFRGELSPDITFLGFQITASEAMGDDKSLANKPGWFIVIEQQATEPRFGLDETISTTDEEQMKKWTWRDLAWPHVDLASKNEYVNLKGGIKPSFPLNARKGPDGETWNWGSSSSTTDSAQIACITLQEPVRVYIHASDLLYLGES